ncbi:MAG: hypothetical protein BGO26_03875 [Actinobacteria bacterium 69-20]|jgi:uncharacterized protein YbaA (DUF1428 family)|nr:hypothetical protein [Actinomycetota bacterium]OJV23949.1 MAG: hypothetical protein BGO26_03875 [Actinobacteria bacterium 69-20]
MSRALVEPPAPPLLDEQTARENADALRRIAAKYGISALRFAALGRLVGRVDDDRGMGDLADFQLAVEQLLGRYVDVFADRVLDNPNVSADLVAATAL